MIGISCSIKVLAGFPDSFNGHVLSMSFADPLMFVLRRANNAISSCLQYYGSKHYSYEFDAYLYQYLPEQVIKEFYPELHAYNTKLERDIMHSPFPQAMSDSLSPLLTIEQYQTLHTNQALNDEAYFMATLREDGNDVLISQLAKEVSSVRINMASGRVRLDAVSALQRLKTPLNFHIKNGILVAEAHRLLGSITNIDRITAGKISSVTSQKTSEEISKETCKHYSQAFNKQGVEFEFLDYIDYIDNLLAIGNTGDAKIVAQKARAKFLGNAALEERWEYIKQKRKGK